MTSSDAPQPELYRVIFHRVPSSDGDVITALPARRGPAEPLRGAQWCRGASLFPEHSVIVWLLDVPDPVVQVYAHFRSSAVNQAAYRATFCATLSLCGEEIAAKERHSAQVEGRRPRKLRFSFAIPPRLSRVVGTYSAKIEWQYTREGAKQAHRETTRHRVYLLPKEPLPPWLVGPRAGAHTEGCRPWTDALDYACRWAQGKRSDADICAALEAGLHSLAPGCTMYSPGSSRYSKDDGTVYLGRFLRLLRGGGPREGTLDCADFAYLLATLAALLGVRLRVIRAFDQIAGVSAPLLELNPVMGAGAVSPSEPASHRQLDHHQFTVLDRECGDEPLVFDASLALDDASHESILPFRPVLAGARGMPLSEYLRRLSARHFLADLLSQIAGESTNELGETTLKRFSRPSLTTCDQPRLEPPDEADLPPDDPASWRRLGRGLPDDFRDAIAAFSAKLSALDSAPPEWRLRPDRKGMAAIIEQSKQVLFGADSEGIRVEIRDRPAAAVAEAIAARKRRATFSRDGVEVTAYVAEEPPLWVIPIGAGQSVLIERASFGEQVGSQVTAGAMVHLLGRYLAERAPLWA